MSWMYILSDLLYSLEVGHNEPFYLRFGAKLQEGENDFRKMTDSEMFLGSTLFVLQTFLFKRKV